MKKKMITLAFIAMAITGSIVAAPINGDVSSRVLSAFSEKFNGTSEVNWNKTSEYLKASFTMNGQMLFAYFTENGELIGVSKNLLSSQLPITLLTELKKISSAGWITELFEFSNESETTYYLTVENADQKLHYQNVGFNGWTVYKKAKKS